MTEPNMTLGGMDRWTNSEAYTQYAEYHAKHVHGKGKAASPVSEVVRRAREVIRHGENSKHHQKVTNYNARALGSYRKHGAGSRKFAGVAKNVCALRCWGFDPHGTYTR